MTYRPQHECDDCGYTWHSRGADHSLKCPSCGSRDHTQIVDGSSIIQMIQGAIVLGLVGFIGVGAIGAALTADETPQPSIEQPVEVMADVDPTPSNPNVITTPSVNNVQKSPCQIWADANPSLADKLQPGDSCFGF